MNNKRLHRINEEIRKIISELLLHELKDPRLDHFVSVTKVDTTNDLRFVKVYVSIFGDEKEKEAVLEGLNSAKGFIRKEIGENLDLRYTPEPKFYLDESIERSIAMSKLIEDVNKDTRHE